MLLKKKNIFFYVGRESDSLQNYRFLLFVYKNASKINSTAVNHLVIIIFFKVINLRDSKQSNHLCFIFFMCEDWQSCPQDHQSIAYWKVSWVVHVSNIQNEKLFFFFETHTKSSKSATAERKNVSNTTRNKSIVVSLGIVGVITLRCVQEKKKETLFIATISYFSGWMAGWAHHESTI